MVNRTKSRALWCSVRRMNLNAKSIIFAICVGLICFLQSLNSGMKRLAGVPPARNESEGRSERPQIHSTKYGEGMNLKQAKQYFVHNGQRFKETRLKRGISLRECAKECQVGHCTISRYEHGRPVSVFAYIQLGFWWTVHGPTY